MSTLTAMSFMRRVEMGIISCVAVVAVAATAIGLVAGAAGVELPSTLGVALDSAAGMLGWLRLVVVAGLLYGVVRVRED